MKIYMMLNLILFSFYGNVHYKAEDYQCENNTLRVKYEENWYTLTLFNILMKEDTDICGYINGDISFEFEEAVMIDETYKAYVFVDGILLQKKLIEDKKADVKIASIAYKYNLDEQEEMVMAIVEEENEEIYYSKKIAMIIFILYILGILIFICYKRHTQKDINKK